MPFDIDSTFVALLASEPGPSSQQLAELAVRRPEFYDHVVAEIVRRRDVKHTPPKFEQDPGGAIGAFKHMVDKMPDRRVVLWPLCNSALFQDGNWLVLCMRQYPELRELAWEKFRKELRGRSAFGPLREIIEHVPELRDRAWEVRRMMGHDDSSTSWGSLALLLPFLSPEAQREAWNIMRTAKAGYMNVAQVFYQAPALREEAFAMLRTQGYCPRQLVIPYIFVHYPAFRERAWVEVLRHDRHEVPHLPYEAEWRLLGLVNGKEIPEPLRMRALEELLRRRPFQRVMDDREDDEYFSWIGLVLWTSPSATVRQRAWEFGHRQLPTDELSVITRHGHCAEIRAEIFAELYTRKDVPAVTFRRLQFDTQPYRFRIVKAVLDHNPDADDLAYVVSQPWVPEKARTRALTQLLVQGKRVHACTSLIWEHSGQKLPRDVVVQLARAVIDSEETLHHTVLDGIVERVPELAGVVESRRNRGTGNVLAQLMG